MSAKSAPVSWSVSRDQEVVKADSDISGNIVCCAPLEWRDSMQNWPANARLIAAAPELLHALVGLEKLAGRWAGDHNKAIRIAREAIAKAESPQ